MSQLVTIAQFPNAAAAALAQNELAYEGIKSRLADTEIVTTAWHYGGALGGVKLQVLSEDVERAREVLRGLESGPEDEDDDPDATEHHALPDDDEESPTAAVDATVNRAWKAAVIGLFLCPLQIYALYLLLTLPSDPPLSPASQTKVAWTFVVIAGGMGLLWLFLRGP